MASRMAARSTTAGTPVKSCNSTRLGMNAISCDGDALAGPGGQRANVVGLHRLAVFAAEQVLQQNAERVRQVAGGAALLFQSVKTVDFKFPLAHAEDGTTAKAVHG